MRPLLLWAFPALTLVPMLAGCASLSANGKPTDLPAMNVPPPPPRLIAPAPEPLPEPVPDLPPPPPSTTVSRGNSRPPVTRPPQPESKPTDPKPVEQPPPPPDPAPIAPPPVAPSAQLRTPQTADTSNAEKNVKSTLERARLLLSNVDYRALTPERKKAYDDSQRFIQQSDGALKEGNFVFAQSLAGKAETLAKELAGK